MIFYQNNLFQGENVIMIQYHRYNTKDILIVKIEFHEEVSFYFLNLLRYFFYF